MPKPSIYIGLFLNDESKQALHHLSHFVPEGWKWFGEHMTILYIGKPTMPENFPAPYNELVKDNKERKVFVTHIGISDDAVAVRVEGVKSNNANPHITLAVPPGGKPVNSNKITDWKPIDRFALSGRIMGNGDVENTIIEMDLASDTVIASTRNDDNELDGKDYLESVWAAPTSHVNAGGGSMAESETKALIRKVVKEVTTTFPFNVGGADATYDSWTDRPGDRNMVTEIEHTEISHLPFVKALEQAGGKVYQVGGIVRDEWINKIFGISNKSKDLDIMVAGIKDTDVITILQRFGNLAQKKTDTTDNTQSNFVGGSFAVIKFKPFGDTEDIDIALARTEKKTGQGYKGFTVTTDPNITLDQDLSRRDFTINAIAKDINGQIHDPYNGREDLKNKIIRMVSPQAFADDPVRMMRAIQFASRFDFTIEPNTYNMIKKNAQTIQQETGERFVIEFEKMYTKGKPKKSAELLVDSGLYRYIFGADFKGTFDGFEKVTRMSEFFFLLTQDSLPSPSTYWRKRFKGDGKTEFEIKGFEDTKNANIKTPADERWLLNKIYLTVHKVENLYRNVVGSFIVQDKIKNVSMPHEDRYPVDASKIAISSDEIQALGIKNQFYGMLNKDLLDLIYNDKLPNEHFAILNYVHQNLDKYKPNTPQKIKEITTGILEKPTQQGILSPNVYLFDKRYAEMVSVAELDKFKEFDRAGSEAQHWNTANVQKLLGAIKVNGIDEALMLGYYQAERRAMLIEGNHRLAVAKMLGIKELPVIVTRFEMRDASEKAMKVKGVDPDMHGYVRGTLAPSEIGIPARKIEPSDYMVTPEPVQQINESAPAGLTYNDVYNYQDSHGEVYVHARWRGWPGPRIYFEGAGDILREFSKYPNGWVADSCINEKLGRVRYYLDKVNAKRIHPDDAYEGLAQHNPDLIAKIVDAYENQPTLSKGQELARQLVLALCKNDIDTANKCVQNFLTNYNALKKDNIEQSKQTNINLTESIVRNLTKRMINEAPLQKFNYSDVVKVEKVLLKQYGQIDVTGCGYISPNGYTIDIRQGEASNDHRNIGGFMEDLGIDFGVYSGPDWEESFSKWMYIALDMGFIRVIPESNALEMRQMPSQDQFTQLRRFIDEKNGYVILDVFNKKLYNTEFEVDTPTDYIIESIKRFFNYNEIPRPYGEEEEDLMEQTITTKLQYWCDDKHLPKDLKDRLNIGKKPSSKIESLINNSKNLLGKDPYGTPVYAVDGEAVRQYLYPDFSLGGNDQAYPNFVPENEIWIDDDIEGGNRETTIAHESQERHEMYSQHKFYDVGYGKSEHGAHVDALGKEHDIRAGKVPPTALTKVTKKQLQEMIMEVKGAQVRRLVIFDMDSTLINSPLPDFGRAEWKEKTGQEFPNEKAWWSVPESLDTNVFEITSIPPVFNQMRDEQKRKDTMVVVMTNRLDTLEKEVRRVLRLNRINPDELSMAAMPSENKGNRILQILRDNPNIRYVAFYDDQETNIANVRAALKGKGITYDLYNCQDGKIRRT